jgi:putative transposase
MDKKQNKTKRKSYMEIGKVFFWTATINNWNHLLRQDNFKEVVVQWLRTMSERGLIDVFVPIAIGIIYAKSYSPYMAYQFIEW